jgi:hypothetical protein
MLVTFPKNVDEKKGWQTSEKCWREKMLATLPKKCWQKMWVMLRKILMKKCW